MILWTTIDMSYWSTVESGAETTKSSRAEANWYGGRESLKFACTLAFSAPRNVVFSWLAALAAVFLPRSSRFSLRRPTANSNSKIVRHQLLKQ